jgi:hypothetical protein
MAVQCYQCRDLGLRGGCPKCGKILGKVSISRVEDVEIDVESTNRIIGEIPSEYKGKLWKKEELINDHREQLGIPKFDIYVDQLDKVHSIFRGGKIPNKSAIIISPRTYSKMTWAYSCLQLARQFNYKIFPILDTDQMKRDLINWTNKPSGVYSKGLWYSYEDFLTADILFLTVSKGQTRQASFEVIDQVIDIRSRMDRPTFIISRFSLAEMSGYDRKNRFNSILDKSGKKFGCRYPIVVQLTDETMKGVVN